MGTLSDELGRLRKGRGVMAGDLRERVGPTLRALSGIDDSFSQDQVRRSLICYLNDLAAKLPEDLRLALSVSLAVHEDVQHRFLEARMQWLAERLQRDARTARRRVDEAIRSAEELAVAQASTGGEYAPSGWYLARFRVVLRMDGAVPTALEERSIVSTADGLAEVLISTSVPRARPAERTEQGVDLAVLYGGNVARCERASATYFRHFIALPRPLDKGEAHDLGVAVTIPADQPMNPRYSIQPLRRCDEFDLRIRFGEARRDLAIWNLAGIPRGMAEDYREPSAAIHPDPAGEVHLKYRHLRFGLVYGIRWEEP